MRPLNVYLVEGSHRPFHVEGATIDPKEIPSLYEHEGRTFYFNTADLSRHTITFCDRKLNQPQR